MTLPTDFQFSQGSLQDYVDCPRRFQLRYLLRLAWPAVEAEPALENERRLQQGAAFHRLVHQHILGLSMERLSSMVTDKDLSRWWRNYLESAPAALAELRYPEVTLSAPVSGHRLVAKYDLIAIRGPRGPGRRPSPIERETVGISQGHSVGIPNLLGPRRDKPQQVGDSGPLSTPTPKDSEEAIILDWKTSRKRPRRQWLAKSLQTRVYPYLLVRAGSHLGEDEDEGRPFQPEQVEMIYWFANFPEDPERFPYDAAQYDADGDYLASLIEEIKSLGRSNFARPGSPDPGQKRGFGNPLRAILDPLSLGDDDFPLTTQERRCRYCPYRSLCRRGVRAGAFDEVESEPVVGDDFEIALDFEQIAEIEY